MKFSLLSTLLIALSLGACSGGSNQGPSDSLIDDALSLNEAVESSQLVNSSLLGPEPNYWQCQLMQEGTDVSLDVQYQFFTDQTGALFVGPNSETFRWELHQDASGRLDIFNDNGPLTHERWFVDSLTRTVFLADVAYARSAQELADTTFVDTSATLRCVLFVTDEPVNPDGELNDQSDDINTSSEIPPVAQAIINTESSFGLENNLWLCITDDGSLDLLLGFYANGIGGTYTTRNGILEGAQSSYSVSDSDAGASVFVNAVFNNQADQLELLDVVFERRFQFSTRLRSAILNVDTTATCDILQTSELQI